MSKIDDMVLELFKKNKIKYVDGPSKKLAALSFGKAIFKDPRPVFDLLRATEQAIEFYIDSNNDLAYKPKFQDDSYPKRADPWGPILTESVQTAHSAGTTILYEFTPAAGKERLVHDAFSLASRTPDTTNVIYLIRQNAAGADTITGVCCTVGASTVCVWPNSDESATTNAKNTVWPIYLKAGEKIRFYITNNSQAGDTLDSIVNYQERDV